MVDSIRIALCQIRPVVGDVMGNVERIVSAHATAVSAGAVISVFPELAISGMTPRDLLLRDDFVEECGEAIMRLSGELDTNAFAVIGTPLRGADDVLHDGLVVIGEGRIQATATKVHLSNAGHQDDFRCFTAGMPTRSTIDGVDVLFAVGDELVETVLNADPVGDPSAPRIVIDPIASPYTLGVAARRHADAARAAAAIDAPVVMVNGVGGNDELVFDGGSMVVDPTGVDVVQMQRFAEAVEVVDVPLLPVRGPLRSGQHSSVIDVSPGTIVDDGADDVSAVDLATVDWGEVWSALVMGIADYVEANGFPAVGLGLSGGVDSALVAALAAEAVGADRVHCVLMPSRYSSEGSVTDAIDLATNLAVEYRTVPIEPAHAAFETMLEQSISGGHTGLTDENLQARIRGMTLMALSNELGWLILVCGNRSEALVGYSTLYGDSAGGLAPISDVYKLGVYGLCRWYNDRCARSGSAASIPESILTKAPSAELRPDQRDDQSLPPYEVLDPLLQGYVDRRLSRSELVDAGFDPAVVERITTLVDRSEYKRWQAAPGIMITRHGPAYRSDLPLTRARA